MLPFAVAVADDAACDVADAAATAYSLHPSYCCLMSAAYCRPPSAAYLLPYACRLLPAADCLPPSVSV